MKVIISHDVDHITALEHNKDCIIPKFIVRTFIEHAIGYISAWEVKRRLKSVAKNKWQNIEELMKYDRENEVPSTFFLAVNSGRGLSYSLSDAQRWIKRILTQGFNVGAHGICYRDFYGIKREYETFRQLSGKDGFGMRMHYLRFSDSTPRYLSESGYLFDSTTYEMSNPYSIGGLWEFPIHIMDGYIFCKGARWQNQHLRQAQATTERIIEKGFRTGIKYLSVLFHDRYFTDAYRTWKEWYIWVIDYMRDNGFSFIDYYRAIEEIESQ